MSDNRTFTDDMQQIITALVVGAIVSGIAAMCWHRLLNWLHSIL